MAEVELTDAERNVLLCARRGLTIRETAAELHYSTGWVKMQRSHAMRKLGAATIVVAVAEMHRQGLLLVGD